MVILTASMETIIKYFPSSLISLFTHKGKSSFVVCYFILSCGYAVAQTPDNWSVEDAHGVLNISGVLTEGACRLDMRSAYQQVLLGVTTAGRLLHPGDQGQPISLNIYLKDCLHSGGKQLDIRTGNTTIDHLQPVVSVKFLGLVDENNSELLRVKGASGFGIRILDRNYKDVRIGRRGKPLYLMPNDNILTYYVVPERTSAPLISGSYQSVANFGMNYD